MVDRKAGLLTALAILACLSSSTTSAAVQLIPLGTTEIFDLKNNVILTDLKRTESIVAYSLNSQLMVSTLYNCAEKGQLLSVEITNPEFNALEKGPTKQKILSLEGGKFAITLKKGKITKFYTTPTKDLSILNLLRGLASLFQFTTKAGDFNENDTSGECIGSYISKSSTKYTKTKTFCSDWDMRMNPKTDGALGVSMKSLQNIEYDLTQEQRLFKIESMEGHLLELNAKPDVGSKVETHLVMKHVKSENNEVTFESLEEALHSLKGFEETQLAAEIDINAAKNDQKLKSFIKSAVTDFVDSNVGKEVAATLLARALPIARKTTSQEFLEIIKCSSMKKSQNLLIDLLGATQTSQSHKAFMEAFPFENPKNFEQNERYLQALSVGTRRVEEIIKDLVEKTEDVKNEKLLDSLWQSIASLTSRIPAKSEMVIKVNELLLTNLENCEKALDCQEVYIRALQNLKKTCNVDVLFDKAVNAETSVSVAAMKALKTFPAQVFKQHHKKLLESIFFQLSKKFDSSARTFALDILLSMKPSKEELIMLLDYLASNDKQFEVKTYVLQKLKMVAAKCSRFSKVLNEILNKRPHINNYHVLGQKGLTTVLERQLSQTPAYNESLLSIQEISKGVLKRGNVNLLLGSGNTDFNTFELGIFTSGLSSFVGGSDDDEEEEDSQPASAGMEISVQGVQFRPLVFFKGQSELMGHVWSGTASDRTPAYQATTVMQDSENYVILQNGGATVNLKIFGARSIDLYGQVDFSLWNRNAHTEINQDSGLATVGTTTVYSSFFKLESNFVLTSEPKISLVADIDFYSDIMLCMQLGRPPMTLKYTNEKVLHLTTGKKYFHKKQSEISYTLAGTTLALNQKNNEMCNKIFA